jgi:ABC-type polysaccharide/polyol phosphate export permease
VIREVLERRDLVANLVARELKIRYRGSVLGFLWTVLIPLFMAGIYVVFLQVLAGGSIPVASIIVGVFAWQFTVQAVNSGMGAITHNANLVKKVAFPRVVLPLASTLAALVNYLLSLVVQFPLVAILLAAAGTMLSPQILALPAVLALHFAFNLALALLLAAANVYFRDTQHLVNVGLSAWFFISPVMYDLSFVERMAGRLPHVSSLYMLNPMATIVTAYRAICLPGDVMPEAWALAACAILTVGLLGLAVWVFQRSQKDFADWL